MSSIKCTVYSVQCTVYSVQCTVVSVQCTVYSVQYEVYSIQCAVYSVQRTGAHLLETLYTDGLSSLQLQSRHLQQAVLAHLGSGE